MQCKLLLGVASMEWFTQKTILTETQHLKGPPELLSLVSRCCISSASKFIKIHHDVFSIIAPPHSRKLTAWKVWNHSLFLLAPTGSLRLNRRRERTVMSANIIMDCYHTTSQLAFSGASQDFSAPVYKAALHFSAPLKICSYSWVWVANSTGMGKCH